MKTKLLRKLRRIGRDKITIYSITTTTAYGVDKRTTGMSVGYSGSEYRCLFEPGDTEEDVKRKAATIYIQTNIQQIRNKYKKPKLCLGLHL